jgi:hypothetical protein
LITDMSHSARRADHQGALDRFHRGGVIPAHPLALRSSRRLDERRQRALTRYYLAAGATGVAIGVHTTQFAIHDPEVGLLGAVLELAAETSRESQSDVTLIAGVCGPTQQAVREAELAADLGYHIALLSPSPGPLDDQAELERARAVGEVLPVMGFYLQLAVGGRELSRDFWIRLVSQPSVVGIKVAPFDRYRTLDVLYAVCEAGRNGDVALYTGNDDHILTDLATRHRLRIGDDSHDIEFAGGLLGQWAVWTLPAVALLEEARQARAGDDRALRRLMALAGELTDANAAIFDVANGFRGCIPGINEMLRRVGLMEGRWCLDPAEDLSPGQLIEIDRVWASYPHLRDDAFIAEHLDDWLR